jgi:hypothetical protein
MANSGANTMRASRFSTVAIDDTAIKPLFWPDPAMTFLLGEVQPVTGRGRFGLHRLPLVGYQFDPSYRVHMKRVLAAAAAINSQLIERPAIRIEGTEVQRKVTHWISTVIHKSMGWANDRYVIEDPLEILLLPHRNGADAHYVRLYIEDYVNEKMEDPVRMMREYGTLGKVIEWICDRLPRAGGVGDLLNDYP